MFEELFLRSVNFLSFIIVKTYISYSILRLYLEGVATAKKYLCKKENVAYGKNNERGLWPPSQTIIGLYRGGGY